MRSCNQHDALFVSQRNHLISDGRDGGRPNLVGLVPICALPEVPTGNSEADMDNFGQILRLFAQM